MYGGTGTILARTNRNEGFLKLTLPVKASGEMKTRIVLKAMLAASVFLNCAMLSFALVFFTHSS